MQRFRLLAGQRVFVPGIVHGPLMDVDHNILDLDIIRFDISQQVLILKFETKVIYSGQKKWVLGSLCQRSYLEKKNLR